MSEVPNKYRHYYVFSQNQLIVPRSECLSGGLSVLTQVEITQFDALPEAVLFHQDEHNEHLMFDYQQSLVEHDAYTGISLREAAFNLPSGAFQRIAQAWQYALFLRTHRFCSQCGSHMRVVEWEIAMHCDRCQHRCYPRISPCIIVAVMHQNKILLAQGKAQRERGFYSVLAGFVESGETLEQAVHREVYEEVGIQINNLRYFDSQPWPFPHSLMMGFIADYAEGELKPDGKEILEADWYDFAQLPTVPPKVSIAGRMIAHCQKESATTPRN